MLAGTAAPSRPALEEAEAAAAAVGAARADVAQVMLFGSVARGQATTDSDIDLVVLIDDDTLLMRWRHSGQSVTMTSTDRPDAASARSERLTLKLRRRE